MLSYARDVRWRPLSIRNDPEAVPTYDALHDGLPEWLRPGVARWVEEALADSPYGLDLTGFLHTLEQFLRVQFDWGAGLPSAVASMVHEVRSAGERALDILDGLLMMTADWGRSEARQEELDLMLTIGGSSWKVGNDEAGRPALERRVHEVVEDAARSVMDKPGNAGRHLHAAWHNTYGRRTDASAAYREAVRAVEAAAKSVILPSDATATLGKMIRALQDKPEKWTVEIGTVDGLASIMAQLWRSQLDRHGTDDESAPLSVSTLQAEAALHLALMLVHWFTSGLVQRRGATR